MLTVLVYQLYNDDDVVVICYVYLIVKFKHMSSGCLTIMTPQNRSNRSGNRSQFCIMSVHFINNHFKCSIVRLPIYYGDGQINLVIKYIFSLYEKYSTRITNNKKH